MWERLLTLAYVVNFVGLGIWQIGRQAWGWVVFNAVMAVCGIWIYGESVISAAKEPPPIELDKERG